MALIYCPECGKEISDTCKNCIHCGYLLQTTAPTPTFEVQAKQKKQINHKIIVFSLLGIAVLAIIFASFYYSDPFKGLYEGQPRAKVFDILGEPDATEHDVADSLTQDSYDNIRAFGKTGKLMVCYDHFFVEMVYFEYTYPDTMLLEKDREKAIKHVDSMLAYYTKKYGTPTKSVSENVYEYKWYLENHDRFLLIYDQEENVACLAITFG